MKLLNPITIEKNIKFVDGLLDAQVRLLALSDLH